MEDTMNRLLAWMKTTDLVELAYRKGSAGVEFRLSGAEPVVVPESPLVPAGSPSVGIFHFAEPGKNGVREGSRVTPGQTIGFVEAGGKRTPVESPAGGLISKILAEDGRPVQYGQPLFLVEPR